MRAKELGTLTFFFAAPFFFLCGTLTSSESFFMRDLTYLFHPWRSLSSQMVQSGELPLWNSFQLGGMPFLANCQSSILYPFTILFTIFDFVYALKLFHLLHYALAGIGFYLCARKIGFPGIIALFGGILFAYNGYLLTRLEFLSVLGCAIWLPWALIFALNLRDSELIFSAVLQGLVLSLSLFAGFPQLLFLQILAAIFLSLFFVPGKKAFIFWAGAALVFIFAGAAQWIPTAELLSRSIRGGGGVPFAEAVTYSLPPQGLYGLIFPHWILHHAHRFTGEKFFWMWSAWWGFAATLLILFSVRFKGRKILLFAGCIGTIGMVWPLGRHWPWYENLYNHFFLLKLFRYPPVALYWTVGAAAILLMCGFSVVAGKFSTPRTRAWAFALIGCALVLELWWYSRNLLPTVSPNYYQVTYQSIQSLLSDRPGTVMLSPKIEQDRKLPGITTLDAKMKFRAFLFDLTNLPYRISTIVPCGEPLALQSFDQHLRQLQQTKSVNEARPLFNFWNVTHFLTNDELDPSWSLVSTDGNLKVYRNPQSKGKVFAIQNEESDDPQVALAPTVVKTGNAKTEALFESDRELRAVFNVPFYPGWKLYCSKCSVHSSKPLELHRVKGHFHGTILPRGVHRFFLVYDPLSWKIAVLMTFVALAFLSGFTLFRLRCIKNA